MKADITFKDSIVSRKIDYSQKFHGDKKLT